MWSSATEAFTATKWRFQNRSSRISSSLASYSRLATARRVQVWNTAKTRLSPKPTVSACIPNGNRIPTAACAGRSFNHVPGSADESSVPVLSAASGHGRAFTPFLDAVQKGPARAGWRRRPSDAGWISHFGDRRVPIDLGVALSASFEPQAEPGLMNARKSGE